MMTKNEILQLNKPHLQPKIPKQTDEWCHLANQRRTKINKKKYFYNWICHIWNEKCEKKNRWI